MGDLYEYTMAAAYHAQAAEQAAATHRDYQEPVATFELFVRRLPAGRDYLVLCGLEQALAYLGGLRFTEGEIGYLRGLPVMRHALSSFWERLRELRFTGNIWAMDEGTHFYANQPVLRVTAPITEAQIVETALLATIGFQTTIASKAARIVAAAAGRPVAEFGARHAHGTQAALYAARAAVLGGCVATSNAEAGMRFGLPVSGTMAHSFIMAAPGGPDDEADAFARFCAIYPDDATLLLDTYDTMRGLERIIARGLRPKAVRLDSGDMLSLSRQVRARLDAAGLQSVQIVATGDLDEYSIAELVAACAPIDAFGVGTALTTSEDYPALSAVYKLVHIEGPGIDPGMEGRAKASPDKSTQPGKKQVWRFYDDRGARVRDLVTADDAEIVPGATKLLLPRVIERGV
jgi:nicotinate phosphoribosyltransferase